jgi:hypothetical protein
MSDYISPGKKSWLTKLAKREAANSTSSKLTFTEVTNAIPMPLITTNIQQVKNVPLNKYYYNKDLDIYVTHIKSNPEPIFVAGEKHRWMHKAYSDWDGKEATATEICAKYDFPLNLFAEYKTVHNWTHSQDLFTKEEIEIHPVETLVQQAVQYKSKEWQSEYDKRIDKVQKENAEKWVKYERSTLRYIQEVLKNHKPYSVAKLELGTADEPYALVMPVMDLHFGKGSFLDETGQSYSRLECRELLQTHTSIVLNRITKLGTPEKIITCCGSDWLNIDTDGGTTTKGTPQDNDGTPGLILKEGMELAVEHIDLLRQVAPVEIVMCAGNHDQHSSISILMFLYAWFKDCEDVTVNLSLKPRNYTSYGTTLVAASHGDDTKIADICKLIPHECRELWGTFENTILFTGHKHFDQSSDEYGISVEQCGSLSGPDRWHNRKGYILSRQALTGYIIYKEEGPGGKISSAVKKSDNRFGFKTSHYTKKR